MMLANTVEGVFWSMPGNGGQWFEIPFFTDSSSTIAGVVHDALIDPQDPDTFYIATAAAAWRLRERGNVEDNFNWWGAGEIGQSAIKGRIALDKTTRQSWGVDRIYVSTVGTGIFRGACDAYGCQNEGTANGPNYGSSGANSLPNLAYVETGLLLDPNSAGPLQPLYAYSDRRFAGETIGRGIYKSIDGGNSWTDFSGSLGTIGGTNVAQKHITSAAIASDGTLIVGTRGGIFKSSTSSANWTAISNPLPAGNAAVRDMEADGTSIYAAVVYGLASGGNGPNTGIYGGTTTSCCTKLSSLPDNVRPSALAVTRAGGTTTLWVGATDNGAGSGGIYKSTDGGATWQTSNVKLPVANRYIENFAVAQRGGDSIVVAATTAGAGAFLRRVQNGPDFNNDGMADILWRNMDGNAAIWLMKGLTLAGGEGLGVVPTSWTIDGVGDFDGDGMSDILWRNTDGNASIWLMNGTTFSSGGGLGVVPTSWTIAGVGDFDGDGKSDILWRNSDGSAAIWLMNGLTQASGAALGVVPTSWTIAGVGDFNGDGKSDILWRDSDGNARSG